MEETALAGHAAEGRQVEQAERVLPPAAMRDANLLAEATPANYRNRILCHNPTLQRDAEYSQEITVISDPCLSPIRRRDR